jgi:hypothetical protein
MYLLLEESMEAAQNYGAHRPVDYWHGLPCRITRSILYQAT